MGSNPERAGQKNFAASDHTMMFNAIQLPLTKNDGLENGNVLMSLPTSLVHCILSDWVDVVSLIRLDFAFCGDKSVQTPLHDLLKSHQFYVKVVSPTKSMSHWKPTPPEHSYTHMLNWFIMRQLKVRNIYLHELCWHATLAIFLQRLGKYVRHICPREDGNQRYRDRDAPCQSALIAKFCHNLTSYFVRTHDAYDGSILRVLINNPRLEKLHIDGELYDENNPATGPPLTLHSLKQLKWFSKYGFETSLAVLAKAAPNLHQLSLSCNSCKCTEISSSLILDVARACPNLLAFSCNELYIGRNDCALKPFLAICNKIVNLDLGKHHKMTEALRELNGLKRLNLNGCCRLTDVTLPFLAQRFASTLNELHLNYSVYVNYYSDTGEDAVNVLVREEGPKGYTAAGVASLRAQCTHLHTFHYILRAGLERQLEPIAAFQLATIVQLCGNCEVVFPLILEHCHQMQILVMPYDRNCQNRVWLTVEQLMTVAARCPQVCVIVSEKNMYCKDKNEVDYSAVQKVFPKLQFVKDTSMLNFNIFEMPV